MSHDIEIGRGAFGQYSLVRYEIL